MSFKRIGVWQTAFLGDAVLTLPLLQSLAGSFPGADIYFFVRGGLKPLFDPNPGYRVVEFDKYGRDKGFPGIRRMAAFTRKLGLDLWISPHTSARSAAISFLTRAGTRIGFDRPFYNRFAFTKTVPRRFNELDEIDRVLELMTPLNPGSRETWPSIVLSGQAGIKADDFWKKSIHGKTLGIHPGSTWPTKKWPEDYFSRIIDMAGELDDTQVIIFAGPDEEKIAARIISRASINRHVINMAGKLSLPELAAFIAKLDCYLTNDSGPMHLAWPQKVPTIAVFGPTTKDLGFFPRGGNASVLETNLACRPCGLHGHRKCPEKHHKCMKDILPERVMDQIRGKLYVS
jgi:heptosyltransferase II